ncbi:MAG: STAS domain-containing protein [Actinomycetota bacterium]
MELSLNSSVVDAVPVLEVGGDVDVYSSQALRERLDALLVEAPHSVVVDLSQVAFLDSTGLGTLVESLKQAEELGGTLQIAGPQDRVLKLFRITGLDSVFAIHDSVDRAIAQVAGPSPAESA